MKKKERKKKNQNQITTAKYTKLCLHRGNSEKWKLYGNPPSAFISAFKILENLFKMIKKPTYRLFRCCLKANGFS